jgi:hypothetical protein
METKIKISYAFAGLILIAGFGLMLNSSLGDSATMDELAHIPAGYSYLKLGDNRLNPEHPPLLKDLSALPLIFMDLEFPTETKYWTEYINGQWDMGRVFLYESGNNADQIINWARLFPMLLTILTGFLLYYIAKKRIGSVWALLPLFLFIFSPLVLSHGHYVTTDMAATFGVLLGLWTFANYLKNPNKKNLIIVGLAFGISQLCKYSLFLLVPIYALLAFIFLIIHLYQIWPDLPTSIRKKYAIKAFFKMIGFLLLIFIIGYALVYLVYLPQNINYPAEKQYSDTEYLLSSFSGGPDTNWSTCTSWTGDLLRQTRCLANINIWMAKQPILKPFSQYLTGLLMVFQRSSGGNTGYFMGEISAAGWKNYFPIIFVVKEQLPSLILMALALLTAIKNLWQASKEKNDIQRFLGWIWQHFTEFSFLTFIVIYWFISIRSPLNIGIRHLLPTIPLFYLLTAYEIKKWWKGEKQYFFWTAWEKIKYLFKFFGKLFFKTSFISIILLWYLIETIFVSPNFLSYYNEIAGGPEKGYQYAVDSNYDWGQDLKRLKKFTEKNNINNIKIDYFGGSNLQYYFGNKFEPWQSSKEQPNEGDWLAVSSTFLQNSVGQPVAGFNIKPEDSYSWLKDKIPNARAGYSIFIYKF